MNYKTIIIGGIVAFAIFALCFLAIDYVGSPDEEKKPEVEYAVIATQESNPELISIAHKQGWIAADDTEFTTVQASEVKDLGTAFQGCQLVQLDDLRFFVGVEEIHEGAFAHADKLTSITIPATVITIDYGVLADCPALKQISVDEANTHFDSREGCNAIVCTWKGSLMIVAGCQNTVIPKNVRYIAPQAFAGCQNLSNLQLPEKMDEIGVRAFADCTALQTIDIPQGVRFVEDSTFMGCTALTTVNLPKSIERLRKDAFNGCTSLTTIKCPKKYPPIIEDAFDKYQATVYVPKGLQNRYYADRNWKDFPKVEEMPE